MTRELPRRHLAYLYRILCGLCALAAVWGSLVLLTGGFHVRVGAIRLSSRHPRTAFVLALFCALLTWLLTLSPDGRNTFRTEWSRWRKWCASNPALIAAVAAVCIDIYQWRRALPLWVDEEMIALNLRDRSLGDLAGALWLGQSAPFGWLVLERSAMAMLGTGEAATRAVPLLFGIATLGAAVWVGRRWMGRIAAVAFVLLCWISSWLSHYRFEVKHYTADAFFGLLLPALAVWAIEADRSADRVRRIWIWWIAAAIGHWLSNGAALVTPACAIFLAVVVSRRDGRRAAARFAAGGLLGGASFGLHYLISIRHALNSQFLQSTWMHELLPPSLGMTGSVQWLLQRFELLAANPSGSGLPAILWTSAICGWAFGVKRPLGLLFGGVALSAFAFAGVVPLHQRFSIWMVPALYVGVVLLIDRAVRLGRDALVRRRWALLAIATMILLVQFRLFSDVFMRGRAELDARLASEDKHRLDDRAAVRWLMNQWQPGDLLISTRLALAAVWWYGKIPISDESGAGSVLRDGSPVYEVSPAADCSSHQLRDALANRRRVLLYLGFDIIPGFDQVLLSDLAQHGGVTAHREFGPMGRAAVIDLGTPESGTLMQLNRTADHVDYRGCVSIRRAERW